MSARDALTAARRFGLGAKPGDLKRISSDPRSYVLAALARKDAARLDNPDLEPSHVVFAAAQEARVAQRLAQGDGEPGGKRTDVAPDSPSMQPQPATPADAMSQQEREAKTAGNDLRANLIRRQALQDEAAARIERAATTDDALAERLVMFWSNHFCVSAAKGAVRGIAGAYEREAIRPHVLGRFSDMLLAVEQHPAMLVYLDNAQSTGPNSPAGKNRGRGLNENLAREILELHTLGVDGGYTQSDVSNLARLITGWSVGTANQGRSEPGKFFFARNRHEPGPVGVVGKRYDDDGVGGGERVLADLAAHPSTAAHVARKLATHFVGDAAPVSLVARLRNTFLDTGGDLAAVTRALVIAREAWDAPAAKIIPPYDFLIAMVRGLGLPPKPVEVVRVAAALGQPLWRPPSPKGWPDTDEAWMGPSAIRERLRIAEKAARDVNRAADPRGLAEDLLGGGLSLQTREAIERAEAREQGFELLIMSPEFQRR